MRTLSIAVLCLGIPCTTVLAQTERIGTFDRQSVVIAFYRSPMWAGTIREHVAARDSARRAGDTARVRELEEWGSGHQELAHQQLYGSEPLTNIIEALRPALDSIKNAANLRAIVPAPLTNSGATAIDVTPQLLDWLKADATTRDIISHMPPRSD